MDNAGQDAATTTQGQSESTDVKDAPLPLDAAGIEAAFEKSLNAGTEEAGEENVEEVQEQTETTEETSGVIAEETTEEIVDPATEKVLPNRINTAQFSGDEQEAIKLRKELRDSGQDVTLKEALELVEDRQKKSQTAKEPEIVEPDPEDAIQTELAEIEASLDEAAESELFTKEVRGLMDRKSELIRKAEKLNDEKTQRQSEVKSERMTAREKVKQDTLLAYPSADNPNSELGKEVAALIAELKDENHPDHAMLFSEKAPKFVTQEAAERVATRMSKDGSITFDQALAKLKPTQMKVPVPKVQEKQQQQKVSPASGSLGTAAPDKPLTEKELMAAVSADPKLYDEIMGSKSGGWIIQ